jgi:glycerophosphoryl diester phosphodiesterase
MVNENAWLGRRVIGVAHQGGAAEGPPNTIDTMRTAMKNGYAALEFDVHITRDDQLVLHHDPKFVVEGKVVKIADHGLDALRAMEPHLATVGEVLAAFSEVPLTVEVKAPKAAELTARMLAEERGDRPVIVTAFASGTVAAVKRVAPGVDTAPGWSTNFGFWLISRLWSSPPLGKRHVALQVPLRSDQVAIVKRVPLLRRLRIADRRMVNAAHRRGLDEAVGAALAFGADGIFTDFPSVLTTILKATDNYWSR